MKEDVEIEFDFPVKEKEVEKSLRGLTADLDSDREKRFEVEVDESASPKKKGKIPVPVMAAMVLFAISLIGGAVYLATSSHGSPDAVQATTEMSMDTDVQNTLLADSAVVGQPFDAIDNSQLPTPAQTESVQNAQPQDQTQWLTAQGDPFAVDGEQQVEIQPEIQSQQAPIQQPLPQQQLTLRDPVASSEKVVQTQPHMSFDEINNRVNAAYALFNDISQRLDVIEKKINEPQKASVEGGAAPKKDLVEALGVLRSLQAKIKVQDATIASLKSQIQGDRTAPTTVAVRSTSNAQSTVSTQPKMLAPSDSLTSTSRVGKELAWASYIENYGVAKVDGSSELVVLKPGDSVVGRGIIDSINQYGCIIFVNGSRYAPVNGACN